MYQSKILFNSIFKMVIQEFFKARLIYSNYYYDLLQNEVYMHALITMNDYDQKNAQDHHVVK